MQARYPLAAALAWACLASGAQAQVRIGFMGELSGPQAMLGQDMYDGFMLAVEQEGGKLGGIPWPSCAGTASSSPRSRRRSPTS